MSGREPLEIERIVPGGRGFTRNFAGKPVFVRGALPGDRLVPLRSRDKRSFIEVDSFELLQPGPDRVAPRCADEARCGGCDLMRLSAEAQAGVKRGILLEALQRTGGFHADALPRLGFHALAPAFDYRLRMRLQVAAGRVGFFSESSHDLVEITACQVASAALRGLIERVRARVRECPRAFDGVESMELRVLPEGPRFSPLLERSSLFVALKKGASASLALTAALEPLGDCCAVRVSQGPPLAAEQRLWVGEDVYVLSPIGGFCQVHPEVNRAMVAEVQRIARESSARTFLDLYCGSGNFSLPLGHLGLSGLGIELSREAIAAAQRGAEQQGLRQLDFRAGDVAQQALGLLASGRSYDLVIVDPPRAGAREVCAALPRLTAKKLVLISCDPVTLARDLRSLVEQGAQLERIEAWDMFPQTHHLETLVVLNCAAP